MHKIFIRLICAVILAIPFIERANADHIATIYTSYMEPVVLDNPERPGLAYEIITELFKIAGKKYEVIPLPWARAQHMVQHTPHSLIFPFSRTPTRENFYEWRVKIFSNQTHFITFNHTKLTAETARAARIGVHAKSSWDNWLVEQGYQNVYRVPEAGEELIKLLQNDRLDAWYTDRMISDSVLKDYNDIGITYSEPIQIFRTFLATSKAAPYPHMDKLEAAMAQLRASDKLDQIFDKYEVTRTD